MFGSFSLSVVTSSRTTVMFGVCAICAATFCEKISRSTARACPAGTARTRQRRAAGKELARRISCLSNHGAEFSDSDFKGWNRRVRRSRRSDELRWSSRSRISKRVTSQPAAAALMCCFGAGGAAADNVDFLHSVARIRGHAAYLRRKERTKMGRPERSKRVGGCYFSLGPGREQVTGLPMRRRRRMPSTNRPLVCGRP